MTDFALHPRLAGDTVFVTDWALSRLLLMNDARFPWLILVPRRPGLVELFDLAPQDRAALTEEIAHAGAGLKALAGATKINVGALGNQVSQLHIHVIARRAGDDAWPDAVWGRGHPRPYETPEQEALVAQLVKAL